MTAQFSYETLTPTAFLDRSARVFRNDTAVVDGEIRRTYAELRDRCLRQSGMLHDLGVEPGDRVAVLAPNTALMLEAHYGVLYAGAVLVSLNTRLTGPELRFILEHSGSRVLLVDDSLVSLAREATADLPDVTVVADDYEERLASARHRYVPLGDERSMIALNYTSGTTGDPKGVMYHARGAYLQALAMVAHFGLTSDSTYLWTLPMFHCNGWTFTWAVTAAGGTHVCLPKVDPVRIWELVQTEGVTHLCGAPTVLASLVDAPNAGGIDHRVVAAIGGAPPAPALIERCTDLGLDITHLYGLTETYGPAAICEWRSEWDVLPEDEKARLRSRQGVGNVVAGELRIVDAMGSDVPADGETTGEIALRGNNVMLGYYNNPDATARAVPDGWFRTGDIGVMHPDGYIEIRDRAKDVIISGGENISSVEVESALISHPAVLEAAVVAAPSEKWGERPVAYVTLRSGASATEDELRTHVRSQLAGFKVPDSITFGPLPKTASGKIRKVELRDRL
ncbi:AMP-binding protein [Rhodococcus sp. Z13]|uniref:AMP-binding protein n=1 Tax=Rhodococcus sacchari TaxID=2962047 RepID=A0ACD4DJX8_9NOCA|nr:AMP-binding protein [Rhodococcus sp. Z13]UYP20008.1 AMP-binding protein [Rhodococcus sp. Z13]